jgi:Fe-S cluster assembly iron-binding protein IscA
MLARVFAVLLFVAGCALLISTLGAGLARLVLGAPAGETKLDAQDASLGLIGSGALGVVFIAVGRTLCRRARDPKEEVPADLLIQEQVIQLTERAAKHVNHTMQERGFPPNAAMCVDATRDRHGVHYAISYDDQPRNNEDWKLLESAGVSIIFHRRQWALLSGLVIDFVDDEFVFGKPGVG